MKRRKRHVKQFAVSIEELGKLARSSYARWDREWPETERKIQSDGLLIQCREHCTSCCFARTNASLTEGVGVLDYMRSTMPIDRQEQLRIRIESTATSLHKLRAREAYDSEQLFCRSGAIECPFLDTGLCSIYPVRPFVCRARVVLAGQDLKKCRDCLSAVVCREATKKYERSAKALKTREAALLKNCPNLADFARQGPWMLPEVVSYLWTTKLNAPTRRITSSSWENRLASRTTYFDETWQDDGSDFHAAMSLNLSLPEEGSYRSNLIILKKKIKTHTVYGKEINISSLPDQHVLYKVRDGASFNWDTRHFAWNEAGHSGKCFTSWMADSVQERLMMWEAAKRCRGKILCGGLGLGIFPQFSLSLPEAEYVHIVEADADIISMIQKAWKEQPWQGMEHCHISHAKIEDYLTATSDRYDTVYLDTWDSLHREYLPYINFLRELAKDVLKPGGEVLLWGYGILVRTVLDQAEHMLSHREQFLLMQPEGLEQEQPIFSALISFLREKPRCSEEEFYSHAYRLATRHTRAMSSGSLSLINHFEDTSQLHMEPISQGT